MVPSFNIIFDFRCKPNLGIVKGTSYTRIFSRSSQYDAPYVLIVWIKLFVFSYLILFCSGHVLENKEKSYIKFVIPIIFNEDAQ